MIEKLLCGNKQIKSETASTSEMQAKESIEVGIKEIARVLNEIIVFFVDSPTARIARPATCSLAPVLRDRVWSAVRKCKRYLQVILILQLPKAEALSLWIFPSIFTTCERWRCMISVNEQEAE